MDIFIAIVFAYMRILLGHASGSNPEAAFYANTGTSNYIAYMLIGCGVFAPVGFAFWHIAYWLRWEQQAGTLEVLYRVPTHHIWVVAGTALYSCLRGMFSALAAYLIGSLVLVITTLLGLFMPPLGYLLYHRAETYARKHGSLSTY